METHNVPVDDTQPCIGCGMCCDGTLYTRAKVEAGEEPRLTEHGLMVTVDHDKGYFRLPCPHEKCGSCTIYEKRFVICRTFRCALLKSYNAGEIGLDEAREKVTTAKGLLAAAVADDLAATNTDSRARLRERLAGEIGLGERDHRPRLARQLLNVIALDTYLERWFRNPRKAQSETALEPDSDVS